MDNKKIKSDNMLRCGKRTYFFDVKEASNGSKYLKITESSFTKENERKRNSFILFKEDLGGFIKIIKELEEKIK